IKDALQSSLSLIGIGVQTRCKRAGFLRAEVGEIDPFSNIKGCTSLALDELVRRRDAEQHEDQALEDGFGGPGVEAGAEGREEVVREREPDRRIDLVDKDHDPSGAVRQNELAEEI